MRSAGFIFLILIFTSSSCTIEKRHYRNGYTINWIHNNIRHLPNAENKSVSRSGSTVPAKMDVYTKSDRSEFHKSICMDTLGENASTQNLQYKKHQQTETGNFSYYTGVRSISHYPDTIRTKINNEDKPGNKNESEFSAEDILDTALILLVIAGIIFLIGLAINAIFPELTLLASCLLAIPVCLLVAFVLLVWLFNSVPVS